MIGNNIKSNTFKRKRTDDRPNTTKVYKQIENNIKSIAFRVAKTHQTLQTKVYRPTKHNIKSNACGGKGKYHNKHNNQRYSGTDTKRHEEQSVRVGREREGTRGPGKSTKARSKSPLPFRVCCGGLTSMPHLRA